MANTPVEKFVILLVDDREDNNIMLHQVLDDDNREFITATSGKAALVEVTQRNDIGLIMLDVQMPEMDGFEVARALKADAKTRDISIIFVTGSTSGEEYILKGYSEGAVDYLQKPLDVNVTRAKVKVFEQLHFYQESLKKSLADKAYINKQLEQFVYIVSHDLKSPLAAIITILSLLEKEDRLKNDIALGNHLEMLTQSSHHMLDMITSILAYSRKSAGEQEIELVDIADLVHQVTFLLFPPHNIYINIITEMPVVKTRKRKLQQVFQNLISNAIKYSDKEKGVVQIGCNDKGDFYEFFIQDNGQGIKKKDQEKIFYLFEVTENIAKNESSTGIGLNIMKMIVEEQGGKVWVDTEEGKGSCFYFLWRK